MRLAYALVVAAPPDSGALTDDIVGAARTGLPAGAVIEDRWLAEGEAWESEFSADDASGEAMAIRDRVSATLAGLPVDVNVVASDLAFRRKALLVADMESTIIGQELIDELADYVDLREKIEGITARAMRGELEFEGALRERVALLAGIPATVLDEVYTKRVTLMPGALTLVANMKANGAYCALVSGGFTVFTDRVRDRVGFDEEQANVLEIENGRLAGRVREPILGRTAKRTALVRIAKARGLDLVQTLAVGDGANDLDMISAAGLGVAFRAKPKVQDAARALPTGAVITHGDLRGLLYLQGYRRDEFVHR